MSFVTTQPEVLEAVASALQRIGAGISSTNASAAEPITGVVPPANDVVSALTAAQFATHGQTYQSISAQAQAIHEQFVAALMTGANSYATTEAANAAVAG